MKLTFEEARSAYREKFPSSPFFDTWVPSTKFLTAELDDAGNLTISREDEGIYGIAIGTSPSIPDSWNNFSMESAGIAALPEDFKVAARWDCYWAPTISGTLPTIDFATDAEIKRFLDTHAPESSVYPGNNEIQKWIIIREAQELVGVAAICKWQSGKLMISSVATHSDFRGKGFGKKLMRETLIAGHELGVDLLCLGVRHSNISAQRLYASLGFTLMHNFTYCERR
jgi:GNAT superfamily N-acetyltransferase